MVAEGPGRGRSGVALPDALERKYPRAGHSRRGSGFCAAHAFDRSTERCQKAAITCMTRPFSALFKRAVEQAGITKPATPHTLRHSVRDGLAPQRLRHRTAGSARPFRRLYDDDLHACAESWRCRSALTLDALPPSLVRGRAAQVNPRIHYPCAKAIGAASNGRLRKVLLRPLMAGSSPSLPDGSNLRCYSAVGF